MPGPFDAPVHAFAAGVASPTDPIWMDQCREDEIRATVGECIERRNPVSAHCPLAGAARRCMAPGVRTIEHGTLINDDTARCVAELRACILPTIFVLTEAVRELGLPPASQEKMDFKNQLE